MSSNQSVAIRAVATAGLAGATFMTALDTTIANVALPHIQGNLSASQDQITWVLTSYMVASAIMTPLSGWLALKIGRRTMVLASIIAFAAVSILCGMAHTLPEMVLFRLLQGIAGASMIPISQAIILDLWPLETIPKVMAIWSMATTVAPILGPTIGGYLTEHYSWRWVFYLNVPMGVIAFLAVYLALERDHGGKERPFDALGFGSLVLFSAAIQLMVDRGTGQDWFSSREIWVYAVAASCALYVFIMQTLTSEQPFFHRDILRDANFVSCTAYAIVITAMLFSTTALLPTFMQSLLGYSAMQSGIASSARGLGSVLALMTAPILALRIGPRRTIALGVAAAVISLWFMGHFDLSMNDRPIMTTGFVLGLGQGWIFNPMSVLGFLTLDPRHRTEGAVFANTLRTLGGSLGIAATQAMLIRQTAAAHERLAAHVVPSDPMIRWTLPHVFDGTVGALEALNGEVTRQAAMIGYDAAFGGMCLITLCTLPLLLAIRTGKPDSSMSVEIQVE